MEEIYLYKIQAFFNSLNVLNQMFLKCVELLLLLRVGGGWGASTIHFKFRLLCHKVALMVSVLSMFFLVVEGSYMVNLGFQ